MVREFEEALLALVDFDLEFFNSQVQIFPGLYY